MEVKKTATVNAAQLLGLQEELGALKQIDRRTASPFRAIRSKDISELERVRFVMKAAR